MSDADHQPSRTRVPMPVAALSDPHMGEAARHPERTEKIISAIFVLAIIFIALFGAAYWQNWNPWILGGTIGVGLFLLGFGLTAWGKYLMPQGPFVEERHTLAGTQEERDAMSAALVERTTVVVKRRKVLGGLFATGAGIFGIVAIFPLAALARPGAQGILRRDELAPRQRAGRCERAAGHQGHPRHGRDHDRLSRATPC